MMVHTAAIFRSFLKGTNLPEKQFTAEYLPKWRTLDIVGSSILSRLLFGAAYTTFYIIFAPNAWWFLLLPVHFLMGPVQGAIVNWCGHKYGYSNYDNGDHSKNSSPFGVVLMGELFQNNHHHQMNNPNFARKWFEFDTTFLVMKLLNKVRIIRILPVVARTS
jgi:stearoyl-CoA desaturase (delta-9 desaturase)